MELQGPAGYLESRFTPGGPAAAVLAPPHPQFGGNMDNPAVRVMESCLQEAGMTTLCFNFRGTGASAGKQTGDMQECMDDYRTALDALARDHTAPLLAAGYSWGGLTAAALGDDPRIGSLLLLAPPPGRLELTSGDKPVHLIYGSDDNFAEPDALAQLADRPATSLATIDGADHFFSTGGLDELAVLVRQIISP